VKTPFYRVLGNFGGIEAEWKAVPGSAYYVGKAPDPNAEKKEEGAEEFALDPRLYKENGFKRREDAEEMIESLKKTDPYEGVVSAVSRKKEKKNAPLLYNLAELQNDCSRLFKLAPDQTLQAAQELYEKKMTTYPRTDARVLSTAVAKVIDRNIKGLTRFEAVSSFAGEVLENGSYKPIGKSRYTNDKAITDHYAIIPTGSIQNLGSLNPTLRKVYELICRRFLSIFYPAAEYDRTQVTIKVGDESFFAGARVLVKEGWLKVSNVRGARKGPENEEEDKNEEEPQTNEALLKTLKKGMSLPINELFIREGETSPPKRYTSGSMILAMENAGQLIEDESLREMIKGSGIGTSATRAEILKKLVSIGYLNLNAKTQVITPELLGEMVFDTVNASIRPLLNPDLTASWEKGLTGVAEGTITEEEYMEKLRGFIERRTAAVRGLYNQGQLKLMYDEAAKYYKKPAAKAAKVSGTRRRTEKK
jgi:DNA topoisomerase-3